MSDFSIALLLGSSILVALFSGVWIFAALMLASVVCLFFGADMSLLQTGSMLRATLWKTLNSWELSAVPVFMLMGELFFAAGLSNDLFNALMKRLRRLPGGLLHANVWGCTAFAAISGSSTATMMTIGRVTVPELRRRGYSDAVSLGSLAGAGSFGILIPPSIPLIVYGILAEQSVSKLFAAGLLPGLLVAGLYSLYIVFIAISNRGGRPDEVVARAEAASTENAPSRGGVVATFAIIVIVLGGIYSGVVTPSEAAVLGLVVTVAICAWKRVLSWGAFATALRATVINAANILMILAAASFLSAAAGSLRMPQYLIGLITDLDLSWLGLILALTFVYLILGMLIDGMSMMVVTLPIVLPVIVAAGADPIWFGIYMVLMIEIGLLTPPVGIHLFVMQSLSGRSLAWTTWAALPFTLLLALGTAIIAAFPQIALWLPGQM